MPRPLVAYSLTLLVFLAIDFVWLAFVARQFYVGQLGTMMLPRPNFVAAGLFYLIFCLGLLVFAVEPALSLKSGLHALAWGGLLGLVAYATYDLSNLATLKNWPLRMTLVDIGWGTALGAASAFGGYWLTRLTPYAA